MKSLSLVCTASLGLAVLSAAQPARAADPVIQQVGQPLPRAGNLTAGIRRYLRYRILDGVSRPIDLWTRDLRYVEKDGRRLLHLHQTWTGPNSAPHTLTIDSWIEPDTLRPVSHHRAYARAEETRDEGFQFTAEQVLPVDQTGLARPGAAVPTPEGTYNWELDMELLQALPLAAGYEVSLNFYHPGGAPPARYLYRVSGSESLAGPDDRPIDCWLVTARFSSAGDTRFWLSKTDQTVLKVEQPQSDGSMTVKTLLY